MPFSQLPACLSSLLSRLCRSLDVRIRTRLHSLLIGVILCVSPRRTVTAWIDTAGLTDDFRQVYPALTSVARRREHMAADLLRAILALPDLQAATRLTFSLDDSPTKRYGKHVQGAGIHRNPTGGAVRHKYCYGHVWVVLALTFTHPTRGTITLPLRAELYIRQTDLAKLAAQARAKAKPGRKAKVVRAFRTKLQIAAELLRWLRQQLTLAKCSLPVWLVADGAYAARPVLRAANQAGMKMVSRVRYNAALCSMPVAPKKRGPGKAKKYGDTKLSLAVRAGQKTGWTQETMSLYGQEQVKKYKQFEATWRVAGGKVNVVLVNEPDSVKGYRAYFSTDMSASAKDILSAVAMRTHIEQVFADLKCVCKAGQQQCRKLERNEGAMGLCVWGYSVVEMWALGQTDEQLLAGTGRPWRTGKVRASHASKRKALLRGELRQEYQAVLGERANEPQFSRLLERVLQIAA